MFDAVTWTDVVLERRLVGRGLVEDVSWSDVSWDAVSWSDVSWTDVSWNDVSWTRRLLGGQRGR